MAETDGTGDAGRELLAALDRATTSTTRETSARRLPGGLIRVRGTRHQFRLSTAKRLADGGLIELDEQTNPLRIRITDKGAELLGA